MGSDFEELYRYLVDDFILRCALNLSDKDFVLKDKYFGFYRKGKREYLKEDKNRAFVKRLNDYFASTIEVPRIWRGRKQKIETLINEEALMFAMKTLTLGSWLFGSKKTFSTSILFQ